MGITAILGCAKTMSFRFVSRVGSVSELHSRTSAKVGPAGPAAASLYDSRDRRPTPSELAVPEALLGQRLLRARDNRYRIVNGKTIATNVQPVQPRIGSNDPRCGACYFKGIVYDASQQVDIGPQSDVVNKR